VHAGVYIYMCACVFDRSVSRTCVSNSEPKADLSLSEAHDGIVCCPGRDAIERNDGDATLQSSTLQQGLAGGLAVRTVRKRRKIQRVVNEHIGGNTDITTYGLMCRL
jgi:hypothetical protein